MIIPITAESGAISEWAMIEMQGLIELQDNQPTNEDLAVATLRLSNSGKDAMLMTVGYHQIEGKKVPLKKPVAVMEKRDAADQESQGSYHVVGIIRNKYLFKTRPRAMISKPGSR